MCPTNPYTTSSTMTRQGNLPGNYSAITIGHLPSYNDRMVLVRWYSRILQEVEYVIHAFEEPFAHPLECLVFKGFFRRRRTAVVWVLLRSLVFLQPFTQGTVLRLQFSTLRRKLTFSVCIASMLYRIDAISEVSLLNTCDMSVTCSFISIKMREIYDICK